MMDKTETPQWVKNVIHTCMGLQRGEKVLVVVDEPLAHARDALLAEAARTAPAELWSYTFPNASRPLDAYPPALLNLLTQADAIILLLAAMDTTKEIPAWNGGKAAIVQGTARAGIGAFIDQGILDREMSADYKQIAAFTSSLAQRLAGSSRARITTRWERICDCRSKAGNGEQIRASCAVAACSATCPPVKSTSRRSKTAPRACW